MFSCVNSTTVQCSDTTTTIETATEALKSLKHALDDIVPHLCSSSAFALLSRLVEELAVRALVDSGSTDAAARP